MNDLLPLFPLELVVYPGEDLNLHIFEPRYKQLIGECERTGGAFGIPAYLNGRIQETGTEIELSRIVNRYADGKMDIETRGMSIFSIRKFHAALPGKLYAGAEITRLKNDMESDALLGERILRLVAELFQLLNVDRPLPADGASSRTYDLAHYIAMSVEQEYALLCILEERKRQEFMIDHLERLLPMVREMENLRRKAQMNGHFRDIIPPHF
jgi:Lon protease-like protein